MAKRRSRKSLGRVLAPINPSVHFLLFLILALFLVIIVAGLMKQTGSQIRAKFFCPTTNFNLSEAYQACNGKFKMSKDDTGCPIYECLVSPAPAATMIPVNPRNPNLAPR